MVCSSSVLVVFAAGVGALVLARDGTISATAHQEVRAHYVLNVLTGLAQDSSCLLAGDFSDFDLALPVLDACLEVSSRVLLVNELKRIRHVRDLELQSLLLFL